MSTNMHALLELLSAIHSETFHTLKSLKNQIMLLSQNELLEIKTDFIKAATYRLMDAFKCFELELKLEQHQNNSLMNSGHRGSNDHLNTPFVLKGESYDSFVSTSVAQPNCTPFQLNVVGNNDNNIDSEQSASDNQNDLFKIPSTKFSNKTSVMMASTRSQTIGSHRNQKLTENYQSNAVTEMLASNDECDPVDSDEDNSVTDMALPIIPKDTDLQFNLNSIDHEDLESKGPLRKMLRLNSNSDLQFDNSLYNEPKNPKNSANQEHDQKINHGRFKQREWLCYYCREEKRRDFRNFSFDDINNLYDHWTTSHSENQACKRFRFYSNDLIQCQDGDCHYYSAFVCLQKHNKNKHNVNQFVVDYNGRCALCPNITDLKQHHCNQLNIAEKLNIFNPILYTNEEVNELLSILDRKMFRCSHCSLTFENKNDMRQHHNMIHSERSLSYEMVEEKLATAYICGCCHSEMEPKLFAQHLKNKFRYRRFDTTSEWHRRIEIVFLKTRIVFPNGLVFFEQNLLGTSFSRFNGFKNLVKELADSMKRK